jgi:site-specific DNA recombinase
MSAAVTLDRARPAAVTHGGGRVPFAYNRRSKFRPKDLDVEVTRAVHRQRADADAAALDRDLGPVTHITDEGQSASRFASKSRDGWPVLLDAVWSGQVSYVLVWLLDRVIRQTRDLDDLLDACRETGTLILQTGTGTVINADDPDSVAMAKIQGVLAETEVAKMSKRVRRAHAEKARLGQFSGGKRRFGYSVDMSEHNIAEAAIIRKVAADIIKGRTLHNIAKELNSNGTPPPLWKGIPYAMGEWTGSNLGTMMKRPHLAGIRVHTVRTGNGDPVTTMTDAAWVPILDRPTWETVVAILSASGRRTTPNTARAHLLAGIAKCGVCGAGIRSKSTGAGKPGAYACPRAHVQRPRDLVDMVVVGDVVGLLARPDFASVFLREESGDRATLEARIESLEAEMDGYADERRAGLITPRQMHKMTADAEADIARLRATLATLAVAARVPAVLDGLAGNPNAAAAWDGLDLDRRRAVIGALAEVTINRAAHRGAAFDPETVSVRWRVGAPAAV